MNLTDYFDRIYVINLPARADRRKEMTGELKRIGLSFDCPKVRLFPAVRPDDAGPFPSIGARGCFMSHLGILTEARQNGFERILLLEDDLNFVKNFARKIKSVLNGLPETAWSVFYGGYGFAGEVTLKPVDGLARIAPDIGIRLTHFVGLQEPALGMAADYFTAMLAKQPGDPTGGPMHVDGAYSWFRKDNPELVTIGACPELGYQRPSRSDILLPGWKDKAPLIRGLVGLGRKLKNTLLRK